MKEADITISGKPCTESQSMTIRVALQNFGMFLQEKRLGRDERGQAMTKAYLSRIAEINQMIAETAE